MGDKGAAKFFQVTDQQPRSGLLHSYSSTEIISLFPSNIGVERYNVLNQKALNCLRTQQLAPTDTISYLDHWPATGAKAILTCPCCLCYVRLLQEQKLYLTPLLPHLFISCLLKSPSKSIFYTQAYLSSTLAERYLWSNPCPYLLLYKSDTSQPRDRNEHKGLTQIIWIDWCAGENSFFHWLCRTGTGRQ